MKSFKTILIFSFILLSGITSLAQAQYENPKGIFDSRIDANQPFMYATLGYNQVNGLGDFGDNIHIQAPGLALNVGAFLNDLPLAVGLNMGFQFYDMMNRPAYYSNYTEELTSGFNYFMLNARTQANVGALTPYLEASAGLVWFYSSMNLNRNDWNNENDQNTDYLHNDVSWGATLGAGLMVKLFSFGNGGLSLDLNARYGMGGEIEYAKENSFKEVNGVITYDLVKDPLRFYSFGIGVTAVL